MNKKIDPAEIVNPRKTMVRREAEAEGGAEPAASQPKAGGIEFFNGNKKPMSKEQRDRNQKRLEELLKRRDTELRSSTDEFEETFRADSEEPLTDAVRAARREASSGLEAEDRAYSKAYNEGRTA